MPQSNHDVVELMQTGVKLGIPSSTMELCHKTEGIDALFGMIETVASQRKKEAEHGHDESDDRTAADEYEHGDSRIHRRWLERQGNNSASAQPAQGDELSVPPAGVVREEERTSPDGQDHGRRSEGHEASGTDEGQNAGVELLKPDHDPEHSEPAAVSVPSR